LKIKTKNQLQAICGLLNFNYDECVHLQLDLVLET